MDALYRDLLVLAFAGVNILSFVTFLLDKVRAKRNRWRIPENSLLLLAAAGPFGALAAMYIFRHKTRHTRFLLVWLFAGLHVLFIIWLGSW